MAFEVVFEISRESTRPAAAHKQARRLGLLAPLCGLATLLAGCTQNPASAPVERPVGPMSLPEARTYVLSLVNRDRAAEGLEPVGHDPVAEQAAQRHVEDMTRVGFTAHWGSDGSVPEQRYTEAGGTHFVQENAACFFDGQARELDADATFEAAELEKIESAFINETPPNDGHRRNILKASHTAFGVGLAKPEGVPQPCMAQEFVDAYGEYEPLPATARVGEVVLVAGEVHAPASFGGVGIARIAPAEPLDARHLNETSTYPIPEPRTLYFPKGYETPKPVEVDGNRFSIEVPLSEGGQPGRYEVSVWARLPDTGDSMVAISLRTVLLK
jgi:uncharacterized protein YkwD